jgi:hypothetical protein
MSDTADLVQATWNAATGAVQGVLKQQGYGRRVKLMSITGPANSTLTIYHGAIATFAGAITNVFPADARTYDSDATNAPIKIFPGEESLFAWTGGSSGAGMTAQCALVSEVYA